MRCRSKVKNRCPRSRRRHPRLPRRNQRLKQNLLHRDKWGDRFRAKAALCFVKLRFLDHYFQRGTLHRAEVDLRRVHSKRELPEKIARSIAEAQVDLKLDI
jgi:hypothetical protein